MVKQGTIDLLKITGIFLRAGAGAVTELSEYYERKVKGPAPPTAEEEKKIEEISEQFK